MQYKINTLGFLFDNSGNNVALILKDRPEWQAGKMNGVGGKLEGEETSLETQIREFQEETGLLFEDWEYVGEMLCNTCKVDLFRAFLPDDNLPELEKVTSEEPKWIPVSQIRFFPTIHNVDWMIKFCLDTRGIAQNMKVDYRSDYSPCS